MQDLEKWFEKANIPVKIEDKPINPKIFTSDSNDIFQMTIVTERKNKEEYFKIYPGNKNNLIQVLDADPRFQQVILLVREPAREFTVRIWDNKQKKYAFEKRNAPNFLRKYLMGMDESHLFICELPTNLGIINKIYDAHRVLKPKIVIENEKINKRIKRQGEWFFISATSKEIKLIEENFIYVKKKAIIGGNNRNEHVSDQLIETIKGTFVKGKVCHIEHKTLMLRGWFKVIKNTESTSDLPGQNRIYNWID